MSLRSGLQQFAFNGNFKESGQCEPAERFAAARMVVLQPELGQRERVRGLQRLTCGLGNLGIYTHVEFSGP